MDTRLKLRVSRLLRSSLYSCRQENVLDKVPEPVFVASRDILHLLPLPKDPITLSLGWGCRPRRRSTMVSSTRSTATTLVSDTDTIDSDDSDSVASFRKMLLKITSKNRAKSVGGFDGDDEQTGSSVSPVSNSKSDEVGACKSGKYDQKEKFYGEKMTEKATMTTTEKNKKKKYGVRRKKSNRGINPLSTSSSDTGWFSSEEERDMVNAERGELFFSNSTVPSECSAETIRFQRRTSKRRRAERKEKNHQSLPNPSYSFSPSNSERYPANIAASTKVTESLAVVKRSSDPYRDFKESMVEMIVEKQIFDGKDLQKLLHCFLALNSSHHHHVIIKVFTDIWDALFCDN